MPLPEGRQQAEGDREVKDRPFFAVCRGQIDDMEVMGIVAELTGEDRGGDTIHRFAHRRIGSQPRWCGPCQMRGCCAIPRRKRRNRLRPQYLLHKAVLTA